MIAAAATTQPVIIAACILNIIIFHFLPAWSRPGFAALRPLRLYLLFSFFCFFFSCSSIIARSLSAAASGL